MNFFKGIGVSAILWSVSAIVTAELSTPQKIQYIKDFYVHQPHVKVRFHEVFGHIEKSPVLLLMFTSMTCPLCADYQKNMFPLLLKKHVKSGKLAIIKRDYPADPLSLKASAVVWANHTHYPGLTPLLHLALSQQQDKWIENTDVASLEKLKQLVKQFYQKHLAPEARDTTKWASIEKRIEESSGDRGTLQVIFDERTRDKQKLGIDEVPTLLFLIKKDPQVKNWKLVQIEDPSNWEAIDKLLDQWTAQ